MEPKFYGQHEISEAGSYQAMFWYLFLVDDVPDNLSDYLNRFIHSINFKTNAQSFIVKKNVGEKMNFLQRAFDEKNLSIDNFRQVNKQELQDFFTDYSEPEYFGKKEFMSIMNKFNDFLKKETQTNFFLISKEWFDKDNDILSQDSQYWTYYFIIIWIDENKKFLNVCEWNFD